MGHAYHDRTDWWNYILSVPAPRFVVVQDIDDEHPYHGFVIDDDDGVAGSGCSSRGRHALLVRRLVVVSTGRYMLIVAPLPTFESNWPAQSRAKRLGVS